MRRPLVRFAYVAWIAYKALLDPIPAWSDEDIYDRFYDDDTTATLNFIANDGASQIHNLWSPGDADWAKFNADTNRIYTIRVSDQASSCDAIIYLFHESNLTIPLDSEDRWGPGIADEVLPWPSGATSGTMFVKVTQSPRSPGLSGEGTTYTLEVSGDWGGNAGLATISGTTRRSVGSPGGALRVSEDPAYLYTKHQVLFPANALDREYEFIMGAPRDLGNCPVAPYTKAWLAAHPGNCSVVQILTESTVTLRLPAEVTIQFVDDVPTSYDFTIDDLPPDTDPATMRIHTWTGASWQILGRPQWVIGDTVSAPITALGTVSSPTGTSRMSLFAAAPVEATADVKSWRLYR